MGGKPKSTVFDMGLYGAVLRSSRQRAGYNRAEDFCRDVVTWTGVKVNKEALYRIEKGVQPPTVEQLIAFSLVLNRGRGIADVLDKMGLRRCVTSYAEYFADSNRSLRDTATYDGMYYEFDGFGRLVDMRSILPDEYAASCIDEYYYDLLFRRSDDAEANEGFDSHGNTSM